MMSSTSKTFFSSVDDLIAYLYTKVNPISPLKLQKGLYLLYAYYAGFYASSNEEEGKQEVDYELPPELFPAEFEAWNYGPVIRRVYTTRKEGEEYYQELAKHFNSEKYFKDDAGKEVKSFIDDLFEQINALSDFLLVDRTHEDRSWKDVFVNDGSCQVMSNESIANEYKEKVKQG